MAWRVEFFENADGCPVGEFLDRLSAAPRAKLLALIRLLEEQGPTLPFPYSSQIRHKLRELRTQHGSEQYRVLYFGAPGRMFVLLHAFRKHTGRIPAQDIEIADARMRQYLSRAGKGRRGPP